jgi:hypothetical protein
MASSAQPIPKTAPSRRTVVFVSNHCPIRDWAGKRLDGGREAPRRRPDGTPDGFEPAEGSMLRTRRPRSTGGRLA